MPKSLKKPIRSVRSVSQRLPRKAALEAIGLSPEKEQERIIAELLSPKTKPLPVKEFAKLRRSLLLSDPNYVTSEGPVSRKKFPRGAVVELPDVPPKLWPGRPKGRQTAQSAQLLITFIREVYGPFMRDHRDKLRSYIYHKDRKLYIAIRDYQRTRELPADIAMPNRDDRLLARLHRAAATGFKGMGKMDRRSVQNALNKAKPYKW